MSTFLGRLLSVVGLGEGSRPVRVQEPILPDEPWRFHADGQRYPPLRNVWRAYSNHVVHWVGDSRPIADFGIQAPNYVEAARPLFVPTGKTRLRFDADLVVINDSICSGNQPVIGGIRIQRGTQSSQITQLPVYLAGIQEKGYSRMEDLTVEMAVAEHETVYLRLQAYSPSGGKVEFNNLRHTFS